MYCVLIHAVFFPPYIEFSCMYCALLHVLFFLYILCAVFVYCFIYCILLHALCSVLCIAFCFIHAKSHFGHISGFLTIYIQNFFVLRINNLYFPFFGYKKPYFPYLCPIFTRFNCFSTYIILDFGYFLNFLFFISNSYPAQFFFHLHRS